MNFEQFTPVGIEKREKIHERGMQERIDFFSKISKFERNMLADGREKIKSPEGEEFFVRALENPQDPAVKRIHELMLEEFGKEEAEALSWIRESIKRKLNDYNIIESPGGELLGFTSSQYLEMEPKENNEKESFVYLCYVVTVQEARGKKIGTELYRKFYSGALKRAQSEGHKLIGIIDEAVDSVEVFTNKMGRERMYFEDKEGNIREVPYFCPPIEMDAKTGKPFDEACPEHLMLGLADGKETIEIDDLLRMIKSIYVEYVGEENDYESKRAYNKAYEHNMKLLADLEEAIRESKDEKCFLMSREEREKMIEKIELKGKQLIENETDQE